MARLPSKVLKTGAKVGAEVLTRFMIRRGFATDYGQYDSSLGNFGFVGQAIQSQAKQEPLENVPTLEQPKRIYSKSNPTVVTLTKQLEDLGKLANSIGILSKKQQDLLLNQLKETNKATRESNLESKPEKVKQLSSDSLQPLSSAVEDLAKTLGLLTNVVEDKQEEVDAFQKPTFLENFFDRRGYGMGYRDLKQRRAARKAAKQEAKRYAKSLEGRASKFKPEQLLDKNGKPLNKSQMPLRLGRLEKEARNSTLTGKAINAVKIGGSTVSKAIKSSSIAKTLSRGLEKSASKAAVGKDAVKGTVRKLAGPLISKALGSTALKSIPIIGAVAGLGFAASRLVEGDVVGAGLDAASGLGGPLTAIPALIASIARDIYSDVYGVQPERDAGFSKRMDAIVTSVKEMVSSYLKPKIQPKDTPTKAKVDAKLTQPAKKQPGNNNLSFKPVASVSSSPTPASSPTSTPASNPTAKSYSAPATSNPTAKSTNASTSGSTMQEPKKLESMSAAPAKGSALIAAQKQLEQEDQAKVINLNTQPATKSMMPTTKSKAMGIGNVPDPNYYSELGNQLYFSTAIGAHG